MRPLDPDIFAMGDPYALKLGRGKALVDETDDNSHPDAGLLAWHPGVEDCGHDAEIARARKIEKAAREVLAAFDEMPGAVAGVMPVDVWVTFYNACRDLRDALGRRADPSA